MKFPVQLLLACGLYALPYQPAIGQTIEGDAAFPSPNGRFIARPYVRIFDTISQQETGVAVFVPIYQIRWTGDSKSILVVSHIANGTVASVLHFDGKAWTRMLLEPPDPNQSLFAYKVILANPLKNRIHIKYELSVRNGNSGLLETYFIRVDVDTRLGEAKFSHRRKKM